MNNALPIQEDAGKLFPAHIKAFIFDLDGTLADTMPAHYKACQIVGEKYGFVFPETFFYECAGMPTTAAFDLLFKKENIQLDSMAIGLEKEEIFHTLLHEVKPIALTFELAQAEKGSIKMAIGSGGRRESVMNTLKAIGMEDFFNVIITCEDVENTKPAPDTFLLAAKQLGVAPENCLVFEDGDPGIVAAMSAGMECIDVRDYL